MKSLWKETFGDSSDYIDLVFENYFKPERIAFNTEGELVVGALMSIPYSFRGKEGITLKGLYLCGLATRKEKRHMGIMTSLLEGIHDRAKNEGFDFTFMIPSDEANRRFYHERRYHDAFYKLDEYYVHGHKFTTKDNLLLSRLNASLSQKDRIEIIDFLLSHEGENIHRENSFGLIHDKADWEAVLNEALISGLHVFIGKGSDGNILSIAFISDNQNSTSNSLEIKEIISMGEDFEKEMLNSLEKEFPGYNLIIKRNVCRYLEEGAEPQLWSPFFAINNNNLKAQYEDIGEMEKPYNPALRAHPFGMLRFTDIHSLLEKLGFEDKKNFSEYTDEELEALVLRKPSLIQEEDSLTSLLSLPVLSFGMSLLLE